MWQQKEKTESVLTVSGLGSAENSAENRLLEPDICN